MNPSALQAKRENTKRLLTYLIRHGEVSRRALASALGLSSATVTNLVTDLIARDLVFESRMESSCVGRKTAMLRFHADIKCVMTVEISSPSELNLTICNFSGEVSASRSECIDMVITGTRTESSVLKDIIRACVSFYRQQPAKIRQKLFAVGLCVGGMVGAKQLIDAPMMNWSHLNLVLPLEAALHLPVYAEGITRVKALYELEFVEPSEKNVIYLNLSTGIGMVNFFDGKMVMGKTGIAGEIGHISLNLDGPRCYCGNSGCFEYYCGQTQMLEHAHDLLAQIDHNDVFYDLVVHQHRQITPELLHIARESGSLTIHEFLCTVSRYLGAGLATIQNIYDPDRIIISGYHDALDSFVIETAISEAKAKIINRFSRSINVSYTHIKNDQLVLAISSFVLTKFLKQL